MSYTEEKANGESDEKLMADYARGEREAFRELFGRYYGRILGFMRAMVSERDLAHDLAQETFLKVHRARATYDPERKFKPWLFAIAANVHADLAKSWFFRLKRRTESLIDRFEEGGGERDFPAPATVNPASAAERAERAGRLRAQLAQLSEGQRLAIALHDLEGLDCREVARIAGKPLGTVLSWLRRGRARLKEKLESSGGKESWL